MNSPSDRALAVKLIQEANRNGARLTKAFEELHISVRTYERLNIDQISRIKVLHHSQKQGNGHSNLSTGTMRFTCIAD